MNILHYSLGFPPYRTGGLTKFCMDLMTQQTLEGHQVSLLWPGEILLHTKRTYIRRHRKNNGISSFEVLNPTPVSYDEGIVEIEAFVEEGTQSVYCNFLKKLAPDVIHIHTLMGLHKNFLTAAKDLGIRLVFSAHDFFPICPKVIMFCNGSICKTIDGCENCAVCNLTALSIPKIKVLQSRAYRILKDSLVVKKLRKQHRDAYLRENISKQINQCRAVKTADDYQNLRKFYNGLLNQMDVIHYNSSVTRDNYEKHLYFNGSKSVLIPITHGYMGDCKTKKQFGNELRITYLGPASVAKGFFLLKEALDLLWRDRENGRRDFCLNVYFSPVEQPAYMKCHDRYLYNELGEIFERTDLLVAPSILYETFGYTVLEALSFGVPVIISDNVGAKDLVPTGGGLVIPDITAEKLANVIRQVDAKMLQSMNDVIRNQMRAPSIASMSREIINCYGEACDCSYTVSN